MRGVIAAVLLWPLWIGAFYEWGGAAARGVRELREGRAREAVESLRRAREELPRSAAVRYDLGLALMRAGERDSALQVYAETVSSSELRGDRARSSAAYNLANEMMRADDLESAKRFYRESLRIDPARVDAKKNLEEAIRRSRERERKPPPGGIGDEKPRPGASSSRGEHGGEPPPAPEQASERDQPRGTPGQQLEREIPSRAEAEHWLDALDAERRAARERERAGEPSQGGGRDW